MNFQKIFLLVLSFVISIQVIAAQDDDVIKVDSSIVRLNVGVVDGRGQPITNLNKADFTLFEDGVKQEITNFQPTVAPFSVVMILDMSGSTLGFREVIRQSAVRFIDALSPEDRVAVAEFNNKINFLNDFTNRRKIILNSIFVANGQGTTELYKSLNAALEKLSKEGKRRKAIIVLTDGVDTALRDTDRTLLGKLGEREIPNALQPETNDVLIRILNRSDAQGVTIYPLALPTGDPAKLADPTPIQTALYSASRSRLKTLAERTGGTLHSINRLEEMGKLYAAVAADLRALYTVEYQPANTKRDGKWRAIKIEVNNSALTSKTRPGYFAK
jgi:Ca-activated chloride channel family protein